MNLLGLYLTPRRLRLISGIVLFTYLTTHFLTHALGLISLEAMEDGRIWFLRLWRNPVGSTALYLSLLVHFCLALWAIYQRRRLLAMPRAEALQLLLGLSIVPLLAQHVIGTRGAHEWSGVHDSYTYVVLTLYHFAPEKGLWQTASLLVAWTHGCLGLHFWLRLRLWYPHWRPVLNATALLIPVFGLIGFLDGGREASRLAADPNWLRAVLAQMNLPTPAALAELQAFEMQVYWWFWGLLALTLAAREGRALIERQRGLVRITYPGGREVETIPGPTILDVSQMNGIQHAAVCGGRGRCSTCRVRVTQGIEKPPLATTNETAVLARVGAAPNVRLACQVRPTSDVAIVPLLPPQAGPQDSRPRPAHLQGREKETAILFADLRGFTMLSEKKLPYDVVSMLNRYFAAIGDAVNTASRLESLTKDFKCELVVSQDVAARAGLDLDMWPIMETEIRGRSEKLKVRAITKAHQLPKTARAVAIPA